MIDALSHDTVVPYDPAKRHEAYLKSRQLIGRKPGAGDQPGNGNASATVTKVNKGRSTAFINKALVPKTAASVAVERTGKLKVRLSALETLLKELMRQAHADNAKKSPAKTSGTKVSTDNGKKEDAKPLTAAQKAEKAKKAKVDYKNDHPKSREEQIKAVRQQIKEIEAQLRASVSRARAKSRQGAL